MGAFSIWHWVIVLGVALLLFGKGRLSGLMGDAAQGIRAFKRGMAEDEVPARDLPAEVAASRTRRDDTSVDRA